MVLSHFALPKTSRFKFNTSLYTFLFPNIMYFLQPDASILKLF